MLPVHTEYKWFRSTVGRVADYCGVCRDIRAFGVVSVHRVLTLLGFRLEAGELVRVEVECEDCGARWLAEPSRYAELDGRGEPDLASLVRKTRPAINALQATQIERDRRLREREQLGIGAQGLVEESLRLLDTHAIWARKEAPDCDTPFFVAAVPAIVVCVFLLSDRSQLLVRTFGPIGVLLLLNMLFLIYWTVTAGRRHARRTVVPLLVRSLVPVSPSVEDLREALSRTRAEGLYLARLVNADALHVQIDLARDGTR